MRCRSCKEDYNVDEAGTCNKCYKEANSSISTNSPNGEIEELKSKFLSLLSPIDTNSNGPSSAEVVLLATDDTSSEPSIPITANKAALVSCSPVFKAMLENDTQERESSTIMISDVSYNALRVFINYLYVETCLESNEQMAYDLLVLADKYQVKDLKAYCENFLVERLNWDKAITVYVFAHEYNAKTLQDAALAVITDNVERFVADKEAQNELMKSNICLLLKIYQACNDKLVDSYRKHMEN